MLSPPASYDEWTREELVARLVELDRPKAIPATQPLPVSKTFQASNYSRRKIAIKFCYSGWKYNGLVFQNGPTPLPTVEQVLFDAFAHTKLIDPEGGYEGCGWERCGRTDRGVSAAGQVVSLWVRSTLEGRTKSEQLGRVETHADPAVEVSGEIAESDGDTYPMDDLVCPQPPLPRPKSELRYVAILNRVLPPTIRVLSWSPVSPDFSARFACRHRHYKYFFSSHHLDLSLMRKAAAHLIGERDFRNLCKLDPAKQITNFRRTILRAEINAAEDFGENIYVFDLVGTAFLYHQVRHIMAVLFLVGTGLEHPSIIGSLLNVNVEQTASLTKSGDDPLEIVERKPEYQMADALPLLLWECMYADADVQWQADGKSPGMEQSGTGSELYHQLHSMHSRSLIQTALESHFLSAAALYHASPHQLFSVSPSDLAWREGLGVMKIPLGGGTFRRTTKYVPLLLRKRNDSYEVANERWRVGKGERRAARKNMTAVLPEAGHDNE